MRHVHVTIYLDDPRTSKSHIRNTPTDEQKTDVMMSSHDRPFYLNKAKSLCSAFSSGSSPTELSNYFTPDDSASSGAIAYEHGPRNIKSLPFLGREFRGIQSIIEYFDMIQKYLKVTDDMVFKDWTCDLSPEDVNGNVVKAVVTTRGSTSFEYASTGKRCD